MKKKILSQLVDCSFLVLWLCVMVCLPLKADEALSPVSPEMSEFDQSLNIKMVADFESQEPLKNCLSGISGTWNLNMEDEANSYTNAEVVEMPGKDGNSSHVLKLSYSVESKLTAQNGFWTKLMDLDAEPYDHLEMEVKGDAEKGFTDIFRMEISRFKNPVQREDKIKGGVKIPVTAEWQTVSIPLNKITGIIDFADPESWKNPGISRKCLDELVFIFHDRLATQKKGVVYLDNIRFVRIGNPGPSAMDLPPRPIPKTTLEVGSQEYMHFLIKRLKNFPQKLVVKKDFPADDKEFLKVVAQDTWRFFDEITDQEHGLPLDTITVAKNQPVDEGTWIGDYTNVTNIGVFLMAVISAYDMGFITREDALKRLQLTMDTIEKLEYHKSGFPYNYYDTTMIDRTSYFVSVVDSGWLVAGLYAAKNAFLEELKDQADRLINRGNFSFFYDPVERQMFHGYYEQLENYSDYHYGIFYTETRVASYIAVARGEVPLEHWFGGLTRTFPESYTWQGQYPLGRESQRYTLGQKYDGGYYVWKDLKYVPSWGGSAFEALMPAIVLDERNLAPEGLGLNDKRHAEGQMRYALEELKLPVWGMSPCSVPEGGYSEFGAKPFGSKGYREGVVTPHASVLALDYFPKEVVANLRKLIELYDVYGEYGFYDAVTVKTGLVAYRYLALDQAMILLSINNYLNDGAIRKRFHKDPVVKQGEKLLSSEKFFEVPQTALLDDEEV